MFSWKHAALEHVQAMYEPGTYIKCTKNPEKNPDNFMNAKSHQNQESNPGSLAWNPPILTPSLAALIPESTKFVYISTLYLEVGDVRLAPDQPPPQPPPSRRRPEPRHVSP
jgi:hypothetical protein